MFQVFFFIKSCKILCKNPFNLFFLYKITKMKLKSFECPRSIRYYEKKILGTSDTWSTIRLSHRPRKPVYYIVDCRISTGLSEITYNGLKSFLMEHSCTCVFIKHFFHFPVLITYVQFFKISFENCKHGPKPKY